MEQLFRDKVRESGRERAGGGLWVSAVWDVVVHATKEWGERARRAARGLIGGEMGMDGWLQDLGFGMRTLRRRPTFTLVAIATLALGIGANVSIFSVVNGVLLQPLPYPDSDEIVVVWSTNTERGTRGRAVTHPDVRDWAAGVPGLATIVGHAGTRRTLTGHGTPEVLFGARVTDGLLATFGLEPYRGRDLRAEEDVPDGPRSVVVSNAFWTERLGADPEAVGQIVTLDGDGWEIVGVAPIGFDYPGEAQFWIPRHHVTEDCGRGCLIQQATGRLAPAVGIETAQKQMDVISARLAGEFPNSNTNVRAELQGLTDFVVRDIRSGLWVLMGAVGMVLLIACANVANLLLVRASDRGSEIALREALGAGPLRIARQLFSETLLLACFGGVAGVAVATWSTAALVRYAPEGAVPRLSEVGVDMTSLLFALAMVFVVTILFGLVPVLRISGAPLAPLLGGGRRLEGRTGSSWSRSLLLAGEVGLSLALLLGAGLLTRTMAEIAQVDPGFAVEHVERFRVSAPETRYDTPEKVVQFFAELEESINAIPGVRAAGMAFGSPLTNSSISTSVELLDRAELEIQERPSVSLRPASPRYLEATGIPLLRGRWIESTDRRDSEGVVVISQRLAAVLYPDVDPIGRQMKYSISWGYDDDPVRTIIGVVGDVRAFGLTETPGTSAYFPNAQFAADVQIVTIALEPGSESVIGDVRRALSEIDASVAITGVEAMPDVIRREQATTRFYLSLLSGFSALALLLTGVGLYGVVAYAVSGRTREIGIRIALGAATNQVVGMVVQEGVRPAIAGIVVGLLASWFGGRVLQGLLYGVTPHDPATILAVTLVLAAVVATATLLPARHAARIPPANALRTD